MLAAAGGGAASRDLVRNAAHGEGVQKFFQEKTVVNRLKGGAHKAVHRFLGDHHCEVVYLRSTVCRLKLPVIESRDFGYHIADAGVEEFIRCALNDIRVNDDAVGETRGYRCPSLVDDQRRACTGEAVTRG